MMDGPIPGASLTAEPKSFPYERPPRFVEVDDAVEFLFKQVTNPKNAMRLLALMDAGVSVKVLTKSLITNAFSEGLFTPDLGVLVTKPVAAMLFAMAKAAGIKPVSDAGKKKLDPDFVNLVVKGQERRQERVSQALAKKAAESLHEEDFVAPQGGLMGRKAED